MDNAKLSKVIFFISLTLLFLSNVTNMVRFYWMLSPDMYRKLTGKILKLTVLNPSFAYYLNPAGEFNTILTKWEN